MHDGVRVQDAGRPSWIPGVHTISATQEPADGSAFVGSSSPSVTFTVVKK